MASISESGAANDFSKSAEKLGKNASSVGSDIADKAGDIAAAARDAVAEMRRIIDDFASRTGTATSEAAGSVKSAGADAGRQVGAMLNSAEAIGKSGIEGVCDAVARRPLTSIAIAAAIGMVIGASKREMMRH